MPIVGGISRRRSDPRTLRVQFVFRTAGTQHGLAALRYLADHQECTCQALQEATRISPANCWKIMSTFIKQGLLRRGSLPYRKRSSDPKYIYRLTRDGYVLVGCVAKLCPARAASEVDQGE